MRRLWLEIGLFFWWLLESTADPFPRRIKIMTLEELVQQANEAKEARAAALQATEDVKGAKFSLQQAEEDLGSAEMLEITAYQYATEQLAEANDTLLAYVNSLPVAPPVAIEE